MTRFDSRPTVSEINGDFGPKKVKKILPTFSVSVEDSVSVFEFCIRIWDQKLE